MLLKQGLWVEDGAGWSGFRDLTCLIYEQMCGPGLEAGCGAAHRMCDRGQAWGVTWIWWVWVLERDWAGWGSENSPDWTWARPGGWV